MKPILLTLDKIENILPQMESGIKSESIVQTTATYGRLKEWSEHLKSLLAEEFVEKNFGDFDRHLHFINYYLKKKDFEWVKGNFNDLKNRDFPIVKSKILDSLESEKGIPQTNAKKFSNKIFIVHGRKFKAVNELKAILKDVELEPIVLHEKASASRTIIVPRHYALILSL